MKIAPDPYFQQQFIHNALSVYQNRKCIGQRSQIENEGYQWYTYKEIREKSEKSALGLLSLIQSQSLIGICAKNRVEWLISDFACAFSGNVLYRSTLQSI